LRFIGLAIEDRNMGVRRLFSRGGQNFPGGPKTHYLPKKTPKNILFFSKKSQKHTNLAGQGVVARAPSCPPLRTPMDRNLRLDDIVLN